MGRSPEALTEYIAALREFTEWSALPRLVLTPVSIQLVRNGCIAESASQRKATGSG